MSVEFKLVPKDKNETEVIFGSRIIDEPSIEAAAPDTLRGWMVVGGSFFLLMMVTGYTNSFGVYLQEYQLNVFPSTSSSTLSWIGSLQFGCMCLFGVVAGILVERYMSQIIIAIGGILMGAFLLVSSACNSPIALLFTQGILFGISGSLLLIPAMSLPGQWMEKHRALATGISVSGGSLGGLWMSFAIRAMVSKLGWQWSLRITGLIIATVSVAISPLMKKRIQLPRRHKIIDVQMLRSSYFVVLFFAALFACGAYYMPYYFMPSFSVVALSMSEEWGANISSILNASSIVGRIATGMLADRIGTLNTLFISFSISTASILALWLPFKTLGTLVASAVVFGFTSGSIVSLLPVAIVELFGVERIPSTLGLVYISYTIGTFISSPVGGVLLDVYGHGTNYTPLIIYSGMFFLVAAFLIGVLRLMISKHIFAKF
ncbi:hypothetical protein EV178_003160 [Coemansia sp. RSA 1646]|nr:hypothetical protein EV178_003160 [Coemansia sp. RSA 1646]